MLRAHSLYLSATRCICSVYLTIHGNATLWNTPPWKWLMGDLWNSKQWCAPHESIYGLLARRNVLVIWRIKILVVMLLLQGLTFLGPYRLGCVLLMNTKLTWSTWRQRFFIFFACFTYFLIVGRTLNLRFWHKFLWWIEYIERIRTELNRPRSVSYQAYVGTATNIDG